MEQGDMQARLKIFGVNIVKIEIKDLQSIHHCSTSYGMHCIKNAT